MAMSCVCRHAARTVFKSVRTTTMIAPAMIAKGPSSFVTTTAVKGLSYESGGQGQSPWSGHGGGGDMMGGSDRPPRRVVERRRGDWDCPECGNHVFASRSVCPRCQEPKPDGMDSYGGRRERERVQKRAGDWECPSCQFHNFASRQECYKCQVVKPHDAKGFDDPYGGGRGGRERWQGGGGFNNY
ncbi:unnamed protein product [Pylaiella littoralis]